MDNAEVAMIERISSSFSACLSRIRTIVYRRDGTAFEPQINASGDILLLKD